MNSSRSHRRLRCQPKQILDSENVVFLHKFRVFVCSTPLIIRPKQWHKSASQFSEMTQRNVGKQYNLTKEMKMALYGFGDVENPNEDTAEVLEDLVVDYVSDLVRHCTQN